MAIKIAVTGGRDFRDAGFVSSVLSQILAPGDELVHGAAVGLDTLAGEWAEGHGVRQIRYPARWDIHGRSAGPIRNRLMLTSEQPLLLVAFPGGGGTHHCVKTARELGIPIMFAREITDAY